MNKLLTDIYGSIYETDKAVVAIAKELRRQKTITGLLTLGLLTTVVYMWADCKRDCVQEKRVDDIEETVQRTSMNV